MITRTTLDAFTREHVLATRDRLVEALQTLDQDTTAADALRRAIAAVNDAIHPDYAPRIAR